jgi:hypothetical protein
MLIASLQLRLQTKGLPTMHSFLLRLARVASDVTSTAWDTESLHVSYGHTPGTPNRRLSVLDPVHSDVADVLSAPFVLVTLPPHGSVPHIDRGIRAEIDDRGIRAEID